MSFRLTFQPSGKSGDVKEGQTVLGAARALGEPIDASCGGQKVCGRCRVVVPDGGLSPASKKEQDSLTPEELSKGVRLACDARVISDVTVHVPDGSRRRLQVALGTSAPGTVRLEPAVKNLYVELKEPGSGDNTADSERLKAALKEIYSLDAPGVSLHALARLPAALRDGGWKATATVRQGIDGRSEIIAVRPGYDGRVFGAAFDIGTTTLAGYLLDLSDGSLLASHAMTNPQVSFGADVMSRITHAQSVGCGLAEMRTALMAALNRMLKVLTAKAACGIGPDDVMEAVLVGNTVMHHVLLGLPVVQLGTYPFTPAMTRMAEHPANGLGLMINPGGYAVTLPVLGGFVGADNAAVLIAREPYRDEGATLVVDVGTNGELALCCGGRLLVASCATGPAFEGGQIRFGMRAEPGAIEKVRIDPDTLEASYKAVGREGWSRPLEHSGARGICGSGIVDAVAMMRYAGIIGQNGAFDMAGAAAKGSPRIREGEAGPEYVLAWADETALGRDITVSIDDVRALQLAKAAMRAGAAVLMREMGIERPDRVVLTGAFGSFIDIDNAMEIGMLPQCGRDRVLSAGNAAGDGAMAALISVGKRAEAQDVADKAVHVELSVHPAFEGEFLKGIEIGQVP